MTFFQLNFSGNRSRQGSITSASSLRKYNMAGYAIETSFCGAKPLVNPSSYDLSGGQQSDGDRSTPPKRINQSEESLTGKYICKYTLRGNIKILLH